MITKQQTLEFIYNLSNSFSISMDLTQGIDCYLDVYSDSCGTFRVEGFFSSLEEATTEFIKRFGSTALLEDLKCLIPVDTNMLEVGQTYKVVFNEAQVTDELTKIDDNNVYLRRHYPIKIRYIREIYKVNKCR